ncbi:transglycosylase domain-containing protein [Paenibacillus allorhizosphaerae]|uniref:peptidoglycan glycosyltransferase n=1 Tax=Paenibacillus allorhizosphaerae TaxID=2849866 RepID=A0ABM8VBY5_9BACL|nr:transglycosylase domain-containing protein [Paenibacillus allorhizosphaerae]CAG7622526.1 Biosynthetic peptidoglycan transglycosylase [Paenibacillus allorhizosphaerae]
MGEEKKQKRYIKILKATGKYIGLTIKWCFIIGVIAGFLGGGVAFGYVSALVKDDPVRDKDSMMAQMQDNALTGFVYFRDDTVIGQLRTEEDRRLAGINDIPQHVLDAVFAIEDNDFYNHPGIDIKGTLRAVVQKLLREDVQTGGSTITQQLARRVFLTLDKADSRKAKEIFLSLRMERLMSKEEILLAYLNKIPYGNGSSGYNLYGIKAAAKGIFNIDDLNQLSIAQAAYLAGVPQQPSNYSTFTGKGQFDGAAFKRAVTRQQLVLRRMLEENKITEQQYQEALQFDLKASLAEPAKKAYSTYPYLMIEVEKEAAKALVKAQDPKLDQQKNPEAYNEAIKNAQAQLSRGGYHVYTTIDKDIYDSMTEIAKNEKNFTPDDPTKGVEQIGAVMMDSKTGAILGMMEGRDFFIEQLNHATQAYRQPGSTMKPIAAYIPAIEKGAIGPASIIDDSPIVLKDGTKVGYHIPENWDDGFHGLITARRALDQSYNIPAIKLFLDVVGIKEAWGYANRMGITTITKDDYIAQTGVIGGLKYGVNVKELTNAYATIGNNGVFNEAFMIRKITDSDGKTIYEHELKPSVIFSEQTAYLMSDMMRTVITAGTATDLMKSFKYYGKMPIVGKTGSTQDDADAWFMGYTPDITLGVWAGYDMPIHKLSKKTGGTNRAKNIWALSMNAAMEKHPELFPTKQFKRPEGIVEMTVSSLSGKLPSEATTKAGKLVTDLFNKKFVPTEEDNVLVRLPIIKYNDINYIAQQGTPPDFIHERTVIKREKSLSDVFAQIASIMDRLPADRKRSLDFYKPADYDQDAPTATDPRTDDGKPPAAPTTVAATNTGDTSIITFQASGSADTVGYRLYRSVNHGPFSRVGKAVVMAGDETKFTDSVANGGIYGYYVTAVDVAGKESLPSKAAYTDGSMMDLLLMTPDESGVLLPSGTTGSTGNNNGKPGTGNTGSGTPNNPGGSGGNGNKDSKQAPSSPTGLSVKVEGKELQFKWKANGEKENVKQYTVYYSDKENGNFSKIGSTGKSEYSYSIPLEGYYKITATNEAAESKPSAAVRYKK